MRLGATGDASDDDPEGAHRMSEVALKNVNGSLKDMVREFERQLIEAALSASAGNQRRAAASLGLLPTTLHEKMKRLGLLRRGVSTVLDHQDEVGSALRM
jgi:DNA-binding NtrC family response regulator